MMLKIPSDHIMIKHFCCTHYKQGLKGYQKQIGLVAIKCMVYHSKNSYIYVTIYNRVANSPSGCNDEIYT